MREGFLEGEPIGVWDGATTAAMKRFQQENGFPVTGKPEALSLAKLGLGSATAGVGAPRERPADGAAGAAAGTLASEESSQTASEN